MNTNTKITFAIGLAFLGFVLSTCVGCANYGGGSYYRPSSYVPVNMFNTNNYNPTYGDDKTKCRSQYNAFFNTTETVCE